MKKILLGFVLSLALVGRVGAQEMTAPSKLMIVPPEDSRYLTTSESHSYTYDLKEDGSASVWLRIDQVALPREGGEYEIELPPGHKGEVLAWYRGNGCPEYIAGICQWQYQTGIWRSVETRLNDNLLKIIIPARKVAKQDEYQGIAIGIYFSVEDLTQKEWWGRRVVVETAKTRLGRFVNSLNLGVYLPDGLYARNKQVGPQGWGEVFSEMMMAPSRDSAPTGAAKMIAQSRLDSAGNGHVFQYKEMVAPGESYRFSFMTATSMWRLYTRELGNALLWVVGIAVVLSLILHLIIGKKPLGWYFALTGLLILLFVMVGGLWVTYHYNLVSGGRAPDYGVMMNEVKNEVKMPTSEVILEAEPVGGMSEVELEIEQ